MPNTIYLTRDFDQMSAVAAGLVETDIRSKLAVNKEYVLGLATGNTPTGLYKHLAKAFNAGRMDPWRIRTFNLDEYVGLPGENAQQRTLHPESFSRFMVCELFGLLRRPLLESNVPWGTLVDQEELVKALAAQQEHHRLLGTGPGRAVVLGDGAEGILRTIREEILDAYERKIVRSGGIDLHVIGVGERGHVAFHESGIPFEAGSMLLVELDRNTIENAVADGHFESVDLSPRYAVTMGAELVYRAGTVVLLACGKRKTGTVIDSILGDVTSEVPISYGQRYVQSGGNLVHVLDETAAALVSACREEIEARGCTIVDVRDQPCEPVSSLAFRRDPDTSRLT